jgi:hypothetical protein
MFTSQNPLHAEFRGPKRPTQRVPGIYAGDMNTTRQNSVKDCRLTASKPPDVRSKTAVGLTSGYVSTAHHAPSKQYSTNARRHAALRAAKRGIVH